MPARLTVEQYHRLLEMGILRDCDPIELIEVFREPRPADSSYVCTEVLRRGETLSIELGEGGAIQVPIADLLP